MDYDELWDRVVDIAMLAEECRDHWCKDHNCMGWIVRKREVALMSRLRDIRDIVGEILDSLKADNDRHLQVTACEGNFAGPR